MERSTYTYYELGATQPRIDMLVQLAGLYDVSVDCLLGLNKAWSVKELVYRLFQFFQQYFREMEEREH